MLLGFLLVLLSLGPLPDLPSIPSGSEIRIISPDLRTVYKVWKVEDRKMLEQGTPLPLGINKEIRLHIQAGGRVYWFGGRTVPGGDILLTLADEQVSLNELLTRVYRLALKSGRVLPENK